MANTEIRLALLGSVDEGKRSAGNTILGRELFSSQKTMECVIQQAFVAGQPVTVINTPGWGRDQRLSFTPAAVQDQMLRSVFPPGVDALLLVIRADRKFTEAHRAALQDHMELLGGNVWAHTVVLFTCTDWLGSNPIELFIDSEGSALKWVVDKCGYKYGCFNNSERADISQVTEMLGHIRDMTGGIGRFQIDEVRYKEAAQKMIAHQQEIQRMQQRRWGGQQQMKWGAQPTGRQSIPPLANMSDNMKPEPLTTSPAQNSSTNLTRY